MTRILVVDDDSDIRELLEQFFLELGCEVSTAENGTTALEQFRKIAPHFVFLDVMMPDMNGIEVLLKIREIDKATKIIMISGMHDLTMAKEAITSGAQDYITKPIDFNYLKDYIKRAIKEMFGDT